MQVCSPPVVFKRTQVPFWQIVAPVGTLPRPTPLPPEFKNADERMIYEAVSELLDTKELSAATYDRLLKQFGVELTIEAISVAGFYGMVATVLKGFDVPTPTGARPF